MRLYNVIDAETTGMADDAQLMELARCPVALNAERQVWVGEPYSELFRPTCPIEPGARAAHHITAAMVADRFPATTDDRIRFAMMEEAGVTPSVWVAHNASYEQRWLTKEIVKLPVICTFKVALRLFPDAPSHSNGALYYYLQDEGLMPDLGAAAQPAHRAGPDALVTAHLLAIMLQRATTAEMLEWTATHALLPRCPIGDPWRGKPWPEVEHGFLRWVAGKQGMDAEIVWNANRELVRRRQMQ